MEKDRELFLHEEATKEHASDYVVLNDLCGRQYHLSHELVVELAKRVASPTDKKF